MEDMNRIEFLAQFSDNALGQMASGGYRTDDDELHTATWEEVAAVEEYRAEKNRKWFANNPSAEPLAELEEVHQEFGTTKDIITRVVVNVFGGDSHYARIEAADNLISERAEQWTAPNVTNAYECKAKVSESGLPYVEFTYSSIDFSDPNN